MNSIDDFMALVRDELGLPVTREHVTAALDQLPGWDSFHLLSLMAVLERETRRPVPVSEVLEAPTLQRVYDVVSAP